MSNVVASAVCYLRQKFRAACGSDLIQTCGRLGYVLDRSTMALDEAG
jgi:DNA-binding response OmpR family regulator